MAEKIKKLLIILISSCFVLCLSACTGSKSSTDENPSDDVASMDAPADGAATAENPSAKNDEAQAGFLDEKLPDDSMGNANKPEENKAQDTAQATPPPVDTATPPPEAAPPPPDLSASAATPPPPETAEQNKEQPPVVAATETPAPKASAPLQKVKEAPERINGVLINSVYLARPGDDYKKISSMIYGDDKKVAELKKANPGIKKVKPGQKIYYNSPKRPDDESKVMNFYEESGVPAETYVAKDGDSLKKVSKELLGYPDAWKEVWAINPVESKGKLAAGTELKYWRGTAGAVATADKPAAPPPAPEAPPPPAAEAKTADLPPPPPPAPEAPPPPPAAEAKTADLPPPPPPAAELPPPPPPPPEVKPPEVAANAAEKKIKPPPPAAEEGPLDQDTIMALAGAGIVAAGLAGIIIVRKRKAAKLASAALEANVGT